MKLLFLFFLSISVFSAQAQVVGLKCEYLENPIGIDNIHPRFVWHIPDATSGVFQSAYQIAVGTDSISVSKGTGNFWETGKVDSSVNLITYRGKKLQPFTKYYWRVSVWKNGDKHPVSSTASFETGMLSEANWRGWWISDGEDRNIKPAPYFRRVFDASKSIKSARAYIAAAGLYELYINGKKIGNHRLDPAYTRFDRRNLYVTYDVTQNLQEGKNAIGVILGNGWYNFQTQAVWDYERAPWRNRPAFCFDLRITYSDGSVETISSDRNWKTSLGPIVYNSIYTGEHYDARREQLGWNTVNFNDSKWKNIVYRKAPGEYISAAAMQPIRNVEEIKPVSITKMNDSVYIFNIGRNIAGVTRITLNGDSGTLVHVIHAERLDKNGYPDQSNVDYFLAENTRSYDPFATDIYTLNGKGAETFMPHFDYKGFQYVEVKANKPISLSKENLTAYFMHSDVAPVGNIQTSSELINKIYAATNASYLSNLFGYPTDCPQREKNGWTGDAHIASETGLYNFDAITIYEKWLRDVRDEQQPNGVLPSIIPTDGWGYEWGNGPDWTSVVAIIPWNVYLFYGDSKILSDNYENIKRYVNHIDELYPTGLTDWGLGDWAPLKSKTPVELVSSVYYYVDVNILAKAAHVLHKNDDYIKYGVLAEKIKNAINEKYLNAKKAIYADGFQTELSMPLFWGIVPDSLKRKVAANLADSVAANNYHLDVGILGAKAILGALSDNGQAETAYRLAAQKTFPSWGWWIVNGATTLYENWNINLKRDLSLNHIMFGEIGAWLYKALGGIKPDENHPGFKNVLLAPNFVDSLNYFTAEHISPYGKIISSWKRNGNIVYYNVTIPANASATINFPLLPGQTAYYKNQRIKNVREYSISSGSYEFVIK
ncbi:alpha-rhamnosidase [Arachidicoccus ginsenosidimutans]|nr:alpha-rhamnosidase [Arachidicoccus sp. BS20]